ncbi:MAG: SMP-30/gluconolactonase/LRE family protein [Gemmatimonadales bacterium]
MTSLRNRRTPLGWTPSLLLLAACASEEAPVVTEAPLPSWTFDAAMVFPADRSLVRPEDGVALADGRLIVTDQVNGLRLVLPDGSSQPFGTMIAAGYRHAPPANPGGANGISLEPGGTHAIVADIFGGAIYRVDVTSGATEKVYQHTYGINAAIRDSRGTIWFTQSARNTPEEGEGRMWAAVDIPAAEGAVLRLEMDGDRPAGAAQVVADSLFFANGIALDEANGDLYIAEIVAGRVWRFRVDPATGALGERSLFADSVAADNLELDQDGNLWIASPLSGELILANTATGERHTAFRSQTPAQAATMAEFMRRGEAGESRLALLTPELWAPLPGLVTGVILPQGDGPVYLTTLGDALIRLPR